MSTNFDLVNEFNRTAGNPVRDNIVDDDVFDTEPHMIQSRLALIQEEVKEVVEAIEDKNLNDVAKELGDVLVVTYGMLGYLGINANRLMECIMKSNMSKFVPIDNECVAVESCSKIQSEGRYDTPTYKKSDCGKYWIIYNKSTDKILKSIEYKPVKNVLDVIH